MRFPKQSIFKSACVVFGALLVPVSAVPAADFDAKKSKIEFVGKKADGQHAGGFKKFSAKAEISSESLSDGSFEISIDTVSLWSDNAKLTNHLKNPDFFNVRKFPKITFQSTKIASSGESGQANVLGKLTMLGATKELTVPIVVSEKDGLLHVEATFKLDRMKWGMTYGKGQIKDNVDVKASLVFKQ